MFVPAGLIKATDGGPVELVPVPAQTADTGRPQAAPEVLRIRARALALGGWIKSHWHRNSMRSQLLMIVLAIEIAAALVAGAVTILKARTSTRVEIEASTRLAQLLVTEALQLVRDDTPPQQILASLPLQLRFLRHVRIAVQDAAGGPVAQRSSVAGLGSPTKGDRTPAPSWFYALIAPAIERNVIAVTANGRQIGSVVIVGEPSDEIAEVWENTIALAWVALAVTAAVIVALYLLFGRALAPLTGLARGLTDLEHRQYAVRLPMPKTREFIALTARFNALAQALEAARAENVRLGHRLITAQDDERKRTAIELHDEVGPSLFGLKAIATSIGGVTSESLTARDVIAERVGDMLDIIENLQVINRALLNRLRPMALGHVPLGELVSQVVRDRAREHPQINFSITLAALETSYGDTVDLTLYRCVQESLTNAVRHAQAKHILVRLGERSCAAGNAEPRRIELAVEDDGRGIAAGAPRGFGLIGMQERVQALGGDFATEPREGGGTRVHVVISIESRRSAPPPDTGRSA
jgi:two-component system, NarL family, sensor histidine kinase UhpB